MLARWIENYRKFFYKTRFVSQLPAFLISIFSMFSLYQLIWSGYYNLHYVQANLNECLFAAAFHLFLFLTFSIRFVLLFFNSKNGFWLSQSFWLISFAGTLTYCIISGSSGTGHHAPVNFLYVSSTLLALIAFYLVLSPIWQLTVLVVSLFYSDELSSNS